MCKKKNHTVNKTTVKRQIKVNIKWKQSLHMSKDGDRHASAVWYEAPILDTRISGFNNFADDW